MSQFGIDKSEAGSPLHFSGTFSCESVEEFEGIVQQVLLVMIYCVLINPGPLLLHTAYAAGLELQGRGCEVTAARLQLQGKGS